MRASHWNAFTTRVNQFTEWYYETNQYFKNYTVAVTSHTPTQIKNCINEAITEMNYMLSGSQQMALIQSTDDVKASQINLLSTRLNSITK